MSALSEHEVDDKLCARPAANKTGPAELVVAVAVCVWVGGEGVGEVRTRLSQQV